MNEKSLKNSGKTYITCVYLCSDCMLNLAFNFNLITTIYYFFLAVAVFKSLLLKMAATVMTVEFDTIHHYSGVEENSEAYSFFVQFFEQIQKLAEHMYIMTFLFSIIMFTQQHEYKLASCPFYTCLTTVDDFFNFRRTFGMFFFFVFVNYIMAINFYLLNEI